MNTKIKDEFGDTIIYDEKGIIVFFGTAPMDKVTFELTRSVPLPSNMFEMDEYLTMRRMCALHVLTFQPLF